MAQNYWLVVLSVGPAYSLVAPGVCKAVSAQVCPDPILRASDPNL